MRATIAVICLLATLMGCGKKPSASSQPEPQPAVPVADAPQQPPVPSATPETTLGNQQANIDSVLSDLTQSVRKFAMEKMRTPTDLSELVSSGYLDRVPQAPAGKKFAIDRKLQVYLADQ